MKTFTYKASKTLKAGPNVSIIHVDAPNRAEADAKAKSACRRGYELEFLHAIPGTLTENKRRGLLRGEE
jgi:hypothetical protein